MKSDIKIDRISSYAELEACVNIYIDAYNCPPWNDNWKSEAVKALFACYYKTPRFMGWVATQSNEIIGFGAGNAEPHYRGDIFYLRELVVSPKVQRTGLGTRIITAIKADLKAMDIKTLMLFTNQQVVNFYSKCGFGEMHDMSMMACENNE